MILGLDISTSIVGVCVLNDNKIVHTEYIDLRKIGSFFEKAKEVVMEHFIKSQEFEIIYTKFGNVQKYCYDIADSIIVARAAYHILNP